MCVTVRFLTFSDMHDLEEGVRGWVLSSASTYAFLCEESNCNCNSLSALYVLIL